MNIISKLQRRNFAFKLTAGVLALGVAGYAAAAPDYDRIRKDINVMIGIVKSAFDHNEDCQRCSVRISGHYLADQGIVFDIAPRSGNAFYTFSGDHDFEFHTNGMIAAIPGMVEEILHDVEVTFDDGNFSYTISGDGDWSEVKEEARAQLREARIRMRELDRELRELKIESIHADGKELEELTKQELELESEIERLTEREKKLTEDVSDYAMKRKVERDAKLADIREKKQAHFDKIETIVLNTFCDYSRSMRHLPTGERVSIIMKKDEDNSRIYVLEKDDLESCDSEKTNLRENALSYAF